ncbi:hypothetical protein [Candidatus Thiosymbion oneisti]|uniref:hypothetical protein n=1 Tax=Candidatus Thiosymbion oneisti TaxID=589554 RepID=UPI001061CDEE|nr:hypothetical protein [Candidatus Thiosymbion oneisti]
MTLNTLISNIAGIIELIANVITIIAPIITPPIGLIVVLIAITIIVIVVIKKYVKTEIQSLWVKISFLIKLILIIVLVIVLVIVFIISFAVLINRLQSNSLVEIHWPPSWGAPIRGCDLGTVDSTQGRCSIQAARTVDLVWPGLIEAIEIKAEEAVAGDTIDLKGRLRPSRPFPPNDPWLSKPANTKNPCAVEPAYQPVELIFSGGDGKSIKYSWTEGSLPTFTEVDWPTNQPLPQRLELRLEQHRPKNPAFETSLKIGWDPATDRSKPLAAWTENGARRAYPVVPKTLPTIKFDDSLEVHWYPTRDACVGGTKSQDYWDYARYAFTGRSKGPCDWARLMRGPEKINYCTRPVLNRTRNQLVLDFKLLRCGVHRRLILIALSKIFDPIGKDLQDVLRERLVRMKQSGSRVPFDLLSIGEDQRLDRVLTCEDLPNLAEDGEISIRAKIARLRFRSENLDALKNLGLVTLDPAFAANRIRSILYLTDGSGLKEIDNRDELYRRIAATSLGLIRIWQQEGVDIQVLTAGSCATWRAMDVACKELRQDRKKRLHLIIQRIEQALCN